ncbi:hypothetical protein SEVIR_8G188100v4 [Setaria viridis]|uniref:Uncharacterized protein n=1 Tax=Setaria viridis TaxID=4556 RepID=A0A4U6TGW2_SETVI|nr:hypothetical protein SEVIR_8G188100v2 [Setaria viridis]
MVLNGFRRIEQITSKITLMVIQGSHEIDSNMPSFLFGFALTGSSSRGDDMGAVAVSREDMEVKKMEAGGELRSEDIGLGVSPGHASFFLLCYAKRRQLTSRQPSLCFLGTS